MSAIDEKIMSRCIALAQKGRGAVAPNPMVGAVLARGQDILAEGYHKAWGEAHAEREAIAKADPQQIKEATLYVNLEPCNHQGKTPPCTDLILEQGIKHVVIGDLDPNPIVRGTGVAHLKQARVDVQSGILEKECRDLNRRFYLFHEKQRPYIVLKWAQTSDGFIAHDDYSSKWISCEKSRELVHSWRSEESAVMVGTNTALYDNPKLTVRTREGKNPIRLILDREGKVPKTHNVFDNTVKTWVFSQAGSPKESDPSLVRVDYSTSVLPQILSFCYEHQILSILVEGGAQLLNSFLQEGLWDEARVFTSPKSFGRGIAAPRMDRASDECQKIDDDRLMIFRNSV